MAKKMKDVIATIEDIKTEQILVDDLCQNTWSPNRMDKEMFGKLVKYIGEQGAVLPILVRPIAVSGKPPFEIIDGFHRWKACKENLKYTHIPCVVKDVDDFHARILTVNLNELRGQSSQHILARLLSELSAQTSVSDLASRLPYTEGSIKDLLETLKVPSDVIDKANERVKLALEKQPHIVSFVVHGDAIVTVDEAIALATSKTEDGKDRGLAFLEICKFYLANNALKDPEKKKSEAPA